MGLAGGATIEGGRDVWLTVSFRTTADTRLFFLTQAAKSEQIQAVTVVALE
jgi:hypothetical protein